MADTKTESLADRIEAIPYTNGIYLFRAEAVRLARAHDAKLQAAEQEIKSLRSTLRAEVASRKVTEPSAVPMSPLIGEYVESAEKELAQLREQLAEAKRERDTWKRSCKTSISLQEYTTSEFEAARAEAARYREALEHLRTIQLDRYANENGDQLADRVRKHCREALAGDASPSGDTQPELSRTDDTQTEEPKGCPTPGACSCKVGRLHKTLRTIRKLSAQAEGGSHD